MPLSRNLGGREAGAKADALVPARNSTALTLDLTAAPYISIRTGLAPPWL